MSAVVVLEGRCPDLEFPAIVLRLLSLRGEPPPPQEGVEAKEDGGSDADRRQDSEPIQSLHNHHRLTARATLAKSPSPTPTFTAVDVPPELSELVAAAVLAMMPPVSPGSAGGGGGGGSFFSYSTTIFVPLVGLYRATLKTAGSPAATSCSYETDTFFVWISWRGGIMV